ncbi:hypothetical protein BRYFOR_09117 [Marvinbryantia formatexigens DSM 14469]|uniref:Uncharacterized protein n=1 Tax=Marvinbryantia formatexigens DSM 14469 TaxID=478749 RepID=C6LKD0_9FIRM|nr:hypothetical protein [Marvinbryantia formatexigens]EET58829.1 hypothetical protein BRYFOR_09117 [Marvinbryantia formatexigens DSM 14469]UWO27087.1 hypothetical protein NQ534_10060 [Marvinbryantia formatexigens DSM 14469]SDG86581.1 hypothetical protein SAMN05660368_03412 [Marvinbryantia formatexigens]
MKEFVKLDKYGQLYIDKVLFESYLPIVFTCVNDKKDVFIGVCCQNNEKGCKWLLGKTNGINIVRMLRDEITIRQLLLEYSFENISVDYVEDKYVISYNNSDWDESSPYLPKEDSYMYGEKVKAYLRRGAKPLAAFGRYPNEEIGYGVLCVRDSLPV